MKKKILKLSPISEKRKIENDLSPLEPFWVCDIETRNWTEFVMIGLTNGKDFFAFDNLIKFFDYIFTDKRNKVLYAHFGGRFDFLFILEHALLKTDYKVENMIPRGSGLLCFDIALEIGFTGNKKLDDYNLKIGKAFRIKINFRDSSAMLPFGLKSLTNNFKVKMPKKDWDHTKTTTMTPELIEYCKYDCMGLHEVIHKYHSWPIIKKAGNTFTIAGQALKVFQTFMEADIYSLNDRVDQFVRQGYFGGRTEVFRPFYDGPTDSLHVFDVNSLYPTVMRDNTYPVKFSHMDSNYDPNAMGFYDAEVYVPEDMYVPPLGVVWEVNGTKKFIFPTGHFKGRWSTLELEYAKSLGVKVIKTGWGAIFKNGGHIFQNYVDTLYDIREKSERDSVDNVLAKLLLNSCYGRFGIRLDREGLVIDEGQEGVKEFTTLGYGDKLIRLMTQAKRLNSFSNVAISAWVTSAARVHMHKQGYIKCQKALYYTDTDSIFTPIIFENEKSLGKFKLEDSFTSGCFLLPKTYVAEGTKKKKVVMKGFDRKKTQHFTVQDFMAALEGDLRVLRVVNDAKMSTFKTALRKQKIVTMLPESPREIRSLYDKRIIYKEIGGSYNTRAHIIKNCEPIKF